MTIPNEAVDAAAKALWQTNQHDDAWVDDYSDYESYLRAEATKALEAAAPHLGYRAGNASAEVARAFANKEASKRALVARVLGIDSEVAASLGYGSVEK